MYHLLTSFIDLEYLIVRASFEWDEVGPLLDLEVSTILRHLVLLNLYYAILETFRDYRVMVSGGILFCEIMMHRIEDFC